MPAIEDEIKRILGEQLGRDPATITGAQHLADDLGADSLDLVELVMALEDVLGFEIPDEFAEKFTTVKSVGDYVVSCREYLEGLSAKQ